MLGVADKRVPIQVAGEQALAEGDAFLLAHVLQAVRLPNLVRRFDNEGRGVRVVFVGMRRKPAVFGLLEGKGESVERPMRAEPDKTAQPGVDIRLVAVGITCADAAVQAITGNHKIGVVLRCQCLIVADVGLEHELHPQRQAALLQDVEQVFAPDAAKTVATRTHAAALEEHLDVVPVVQRVGDQGAGHRIGLVQIVQCLVGQNDSPAEGVEGLVALDHHDTVRRVLQLHQQAEIQPGRAATDTQDVHEEIVYA